MKAFVLLFIVSIICIGCKKHTSLEKNTDLFPIIAPIADVDPSSRSQLLVKVPTKLAVGRTSDTLSITVDQTNLELTNIMVGSKMVTGIRNEIFVYPKGATRPLSGGRQGLSSSLDFNLGTAILNTSQDSIPVPGETYIVEMNLAIFETDIPPQHMWSPYSQYYKVLWERALKQTIK